MDREPLVAVFLIRGTRRRANGRLQGWSWRRLLADQQGRCRDRILFFDPVELVVRGRNELFDVLIVVAAAGVFALDRVQLDVQSMQRFLGGLGIGRIL